MRQVISTYGGFFVEGLVFILLFVMVFHGIKDKEGNRGLFAMMGANLAIEDTDHQIFLDFKSTFVEEGRKNAPTIVYSGSNLKVGNVRLLDFLTVTDYEGRALALNVTSIIDSKGVELIDIYNHDTSEINLALPGVYTIKVSALDDGNRCSEGTIRIPVNK